MSTYVNIYIYTYTCIYIYIYICIRQGDPAERTTVEKHFSTPCFLLRIIYIYIYIYKGGSGRGAVQAGLRCPHRAGAPPGISHIIIITLLLLSYYFTLLL